MEANTSAMSGAYFHLSLQESNFTETAAFTVWLNERNRFSYLDDTRNTARINSVILVKSKAMNIQSIWSLHIYHYPLQVI